MLFPVEGDRGAQRQLCAVHEPGAGQNQLGTVRRGGRRLRSRAAPQRKVAERRPLQGGSDARAGPTGGGRRIAVGRPPSASGPGETRTRYRRYTVCLFVVVFFPRRFRIERRKNVDFT